MDDKTQMARDEALSFLLAHNTGVLATIASDGGPRARLVYYTCDDEFRVYFMSLANTRKAEDIANNAKAAFVVSETSLPRTLQIEGTVEDLTDTVGMDAHVTDLVHTLRSSTKYGPPLTHFDTSTLKYYRITPTWIRWGNFLFGKGTAEVMSEIDPNEQEALS